MVLFPCEDRRKRKELTSLFDHVLIHYRAYGRIGNANLKLDRLEEAIKAYEKSLTEHRTPEILTKLRDTEKLKAQREKEAYYDSDLADKARELGNELYKNNDWPGAVQHYTEAIKRNDKDPRSYSNRAACYLKLLALNEALKDAQRCIELDPSFGRLSYLLFLHIYTIICTGVAINNATKIVSSWLYPQSFNWDRPQGIRYRARNA